MKPRRPSGVGNRRAWVAVLGLALLVFAGGCTTSSPKPRRVTVNASAEQARLFQTDVEFSQISARLGVAQAFSLYFAEDGVWLPVGMPPVRGRQAIRDTLDQAGTIKLSWQPQMAAVAAAADLGYTWGLYEARLPTADGGERVIRGKYATVWRKQPDETWKVVLHAGNTNEP